MARIGTYLLLLIIMTSTLPVLQFLKVPTLLQHFQEHKNLNCNISFVEFLSMHYWGNDMNDDDDDRDSQLPFKNETLLYSVQYHIPPFFIQISKPAAVPVLIHLEVNEVVHPDAHPGSLFRPPRISA